MTRDEFWMLVNKLVEAGLAVDKPYSYEGPPRVSLPGYDCGDEIGLVPGLMIRPLPDGAYENILALDAWGNIDRADLSEAFGADVGDGIWQYIYMPFETGDGQ